MGRPCSVVAAPEAASRKKGKFGRAAPVQHVQLADGSGYRCGFYQCSHLTQGFKTFGGLKTHLTRMHKGDPKVYTVVDEEAPGGGGRGGQAAAMGPTGEMYMGEEDLDDDDDMQGAGSSRGAAAGAFKGRSRDKDNDATEVSNGTNEDDDDDEAGALMRSRV